MFTMYTCVFVVCIDCDVGEGEHIAFSCHYTESNERSVSSHSCIVQSVALGTFLAV